jgi:hypothetical protein
MALPRHRAGRNPSGEKAGDAQCREPDGDQDGFSDLLDAHEGCLQP